MEVSQSNSVVVQRGTGNDLPYHFLFLSLYYKSLSKDPPHLLYQYLRITLFGIKQ